MSTISVSSDDDSGVGTLRWAIERANNQTLYPGHDTIIIKDVTYTIGEIQLDSALPAITDGVTINTESGNPVTIQCSGYTGEGLVLEITNSNRSKTVFLTDLRVANVTGTAFEIGGVELESATLNQCVVHGSTGHEAEVGILITADDATWVEINDCTIWRKQVGISLVGHADTLYIHDTGISSSSPAPVDLNWYGILCDGTGSVVIQDNEICNLPGTGIYIDGNGSTNLQVQINGNHIGVTEAGQAQPIGIDGIYARDWCGALSPSGAFYSTIASYTDANQAFHPSAIQYCGGSGVNLRNCQNILIDENTISHNTQNGIAITANWYGETSENIYVQSNTIAHNGQVGVQLSTSTGGLVQDVNVIYNAIEDNSGGSIVTASASVDDAAFYANNYAASNENPPIQLAEGSNDDLAPPVIDADGIWLDDENDRWIIPFSLDADGFASTTFVFQVYLYDSDNHTYTYLGYLTGTTDASGNYSTKTDPTYAGIPTTLLNEDDEICLLATSTGTSGTELGDTSEFSNAATVRDTPPRVAGVKALGSTALTHTFVAAVNDDTQLATVGLPGGMTEVSITFSRGNLQSDKYALKLVRRDPQQTTICADDNDIAWSEGGLTATWTLDSTPGIGEWYIVLDEDRVTTIANTLLDGEWTNPGYFGDETGNSAFPSGDGDEGGDFVFAITILPGDANQDGNVGDLDASILAAHWQMTGGAIWSDADFNGDGNVNDLDASILAAHWQAMCWQPSGQMLWGGGSLSSSRSALDEVFAPYGFADADSSRDVAIGSAKWNALMSAWLAAMAV